MYFRIYFHTTYKYFRDNSYIFIPLVLSNTYSLQCATPTNVKNSEFYTMLYKYNTYYNIK